MGILSIFTGAASGPRIDRMRHGPRHRLLRVVRSERVTPGMLRLTLDGFDLADFRSAGFDDHLKVHVSGGGDRRDYTPRRFDAQAGTLAIDFALHQGGAVTEWALAARPGDRVEVSGPKGSSVIAAHRWLLIGDETALPAIGRCVEEAGPDVEITTVVAVAGPDDQQVWHSGARLTQLWAHRPLAAASDPTALVELVRSVDIQPDTFAWIAGEASVARAVRDHLLTDRDHPRGWLKAGGYWVKGRPGGKERLG